MKEIERKFERKEREKRRRNIVMKEVEGKENEVEASKGGREKRKGSMGGIREDKDK